MRIPRKSGIGWIILCLMIVPAFELGFRMTDYQSVGCFTELLLLYSIGQYQKNSLFA